MRAARQTRFAWLLLAALSANGCASSGFWGPDAPGPMATDGAIGQPMGQPMSPPGNMPIPMPQATLPPGPFGQNGPFAQSGNPSPPIYPAQDDGLFAPLRRAANSLTTALTIEPQVIPPDDPVRLGSQPANAQQVSADLHYHAGRMFEAQNSLHVAASHYLDALNRNPNDPRLLVSLARVQDRMGNFVEAEGSYRRAIELNPNDPSPFNDLAMCHARQKNWDAAIGTLQRAIRLEPTNPRYRNNLALVLVDANRVDDAFQNLVAVHGEAVGHYNLGYMLLEKRRTEEAQQHFARALELKPDMAEAKQMLAHLQSKPVAPGNSVPGNPNSANPALDDQATMDAFTMPGANATQPVRLPTVEYSEASWGGFGHSIR